MTHQSSDSVVCGRAVGSLASFPSAFTCKWIHSVPFFSSLLRQCTQQCTTDTFAPSGAVPDIFREHCNQSALQLRRALGRCCTRMCGAWNQSDWHTTTTSTLPVWIITNSALKVFQKAWTCPQLDANNCFDAWCPSLDLQLGCFQ